VTRKRALNLTIYRETNKGRRALKEERLQRKGISRSKKTGINMQSHARKQTVKKRERSGHRQWRGKENLRHTICSEITDEESKHIKPGCIRKMGRKLKDIIKLFPRVLGQIHGMMKKGK